VKPVYAWAVLSAGRRTSQLTPYGNGSQFQYPIFSTRKEAKAWKDEADWERGECPIIKVVILDEESAVEV